jgi:phytoene dehydrogenase-like protein
LKTYDYIVVGSGITGLTAARILGQHGKSVLLLEKASILGGSVARFRMEGVPFDVGFHFTGGFNPERTGVLDTMLQLLGVRDQIRPIYFPRDASHRMIFPGQRFDYAIPCGTEIVREKLKRDFPKHRDGLDRYFNRFNDVIRKTPTLDVSGFDEFPPPLDDDLIPLQTVLDECVPDALLQCILGGLCMCYGTRPNEVSFATHCRVSWGLQETLARTEDGGDAFVDSLVAAMKDDNVDIRTRCSIQECCDIEKKRVMRFVLTDGSEVSATACIFTIHPKSILSILPRENLSKGFQNRVNDFESTCGFFTLYGVIDRPIERTDGAITLSSIMPGLDLNEMLTCRTPEPVDGPMMVLRSLEKDSAGSAVHTVTALEVAFLESTQRWFSTKLKRRPPEYAAYKDTRTESVAGRMYEHLPETRGMRLIDSASTLTYRDYLHNPDGSAYGIRQKIGQFNVSGRLPLSNCYAAGQSALLPGVIGAMTSAFFVCRSLLGRDVFKEYLAGKTPNSSVRHQSPNLFVSLDLQKRWLSPF